MSAQFKSTVEISVVRHDTDNTKDKFTNKIIETYGLPHEVQIKKVSEPHGREETLTITAANSYGGGVGYLIKRNNGYTEVMVTMFKYESDSIKDEHTTDKFINYAFEALLRAYPFAPFTIDQTRISAAQFMLDTGVAKPSKEIKVVIDVNLNDNTQGFNIGMVPHHLVAGEVKPSIERVYKTEKGVLKLVHTIVKNSVDRYTRQTKRVPGEDHDEATVVGLGHDFKQPIGGGHYNPSPYGNGVNPFFNQKQFGGSNPYTNQQQQPNPSNPYTNQQQFNMFGQPIAPQGPSFNNTAPFTQHSLMGGVMSTNMGNGGVFGGVVPNEPPRMMDPKEVIIGDIFRLKSKWEIALSTAIANQDHNDPVTLIKLTDEIRDDSFIDLIMANGSCDTRAKHEVILAYLRSPGYVDGMVARKASKDNVDPIPSQGYVTNTAEATPPQMGRY